MFLFSEALVKVFSEALQELLFYVHICQNKVKKHNITTQYHKILSLAIVH